MYEVVEEGRVEVGRQCFGTQFHVAFSARLPQQGRDAGGADADGRGAETALGRWGGREDELPVSR